MGFIVDTVPFKPDKFTIKHHDWPAHGYTRLGNQGPNVILVPFVVLDT